MVANACRNHGAVRRYARKYRSKRRRKYCARIGSGLKVRLSWLSGKRAASHGEAAQPSPAAARQAAPRTPASCGRNPAVISGRLYKPLDTAVPQQFFATSMVLTPLIRGLLGIDVDAPAHRVAIAPHLPPDWDSVRVENVPVGRDRLDFAIRRSTGHITADVTRHAMAAGASTLDVVFSPALPLGATTALRAEHTAGDVHATVRGVLRDHLVLEVPYSGGWSIVPPVIPAQIGHRSEAPRVLSERLSGGRYVVALEGIAGRTYRFRVCEPGTAWRDVDVTFPTTGANTDGYTTRTMSFGG